MKRLVYFGVLLVVILGGGLIAATQVSANLEPPPVREAIEAANEEFMAAFAAQDSAKLAGLYTEDAKLLPPNSDILEGRQAIQAFWQAVMDLGIKKVKLETQEVDALGHTAVEVGLYTLYVENDVAVDNGKYIVVWKRESGKWFLHRDIWNTSTSP